MLDFLTFALCAPYSETTDGKQFDVLLEKVADRGRTLYRLFQQPSHTIVKGAGLLMKAIIEEGSEEIGKKMQLLALSEGALSIHLRTALFTQSRDNQLLVSRQLSRHLVGLWTTDNQNSDELLKRAFVRIFCCSNKYTVCIKYMFLSACRFVSVPSLGRLYSYEGGR